MPNSEHNSERNLNERNSAIDAALRGLGATSSQDQSGKPAGEAVPADEFPMRNIDWQLPTELKDGGKQ